jgi:hypothetical protein
MRARARFACTAAVLAVALGGVAACGDDDGTDVRRVGETGGSGTASGSPSGPAAGSTAGSGSTVEDGSGSTVEEGSGSPE